MTDTTHELDIATPTDPIVADAKKEDAVAKQQAALSRDKTIVTRRGPKWAWDEIDDRLADINRTDGDLIAALFAISTLETRKRRVSKKGAK